MAALARYSVLLLLVWFLPRPANGQCSDAGVCSLHSNDNGIFRRSGVGADYLNGYSLSDTIRYESLKLALYYWATRKLNFGAVLPINRQTSSYGRIQGIGDLLLVADYLVNDHPGDLTISGEETNILTGTFEATSIQIGGKFATGMINQNNLPLRYQDGLGTNDLLLGIIYSAANPARYNYDLFVGGFTLQIPFGSSENIRDTLKRGIDLLGRIGYQYPALEKFGIKAEALLIWRFKNSELDSGGMKFTIKDGGLQFNISAAVTYKVREDIFFESGFTVPITERKTNVDGLKRSYTIYGSANYHFQ